MRDLRRQRRTAAIKCAITFWLNRAVYLDTSIDVKHYDKTYCKFQIHINKTEYCQL